MCVCLAVVPLCVGVYVVVVGAAGGLYVIAGEGRSFQRTELSVDVFVVCRDGNHRRIVGRIAEFWDIDSPLSTLLLGLEGIAQTGVGGDAA